MKKSERIPEFLSGLGVPASQEIDPYYAGYFACFNAGKYYEAHDVLEHLWLRCHDENRNFYQGLIQIAGAFVHLEKQYLRPDHPKDGLRMRPAVRLFRLGLGNIAPFGPRHLHLDIEALFKLCSGFVEKILAADYRRNPWRPEAAPRIDLEETA